ncbi:MAG: RES family NAD+ phosphorylase [Cohaesibacter sp.]|nr:RES family NAD+ phosphorylase [Cohaesibacter sp.]
MAIGQYVKEETRNRLLMTFDVSLCRLLDLRADKAKDLHALASQPWLGALKAGQEPASWRAADMIRDLGYDGLIDPSRRRPGLWHITLFHWNRENKPQVRAVGKPKEIRLGLDYR